jgi:multidrug resistance efflux pump
MNEEASANSEAEQPAPAEEDTSIQKITLGILGLCAFMLVWYLVADRYTPYTDQARVTGYIIPVVPRVSGNVVEVNVGVNTRVEAGDMLIRIDPSDYRIAVQQAESRLEQVTQELGGGIEELTVAQAALSQAITQRDYVIAQSKRVYELEKKGVLPVTDGDKARAEVEKSRADVESARARLEQVQQRIGDQSEDNAYLQEALAALEAARLDLARTEILAPSNGGVTSVNLGVGNYASAGQAIMTFVSSETVWIEAYLRENSLGNVKPGDPVEIALDSAPGRVFQGEVVSTGFAVDWKNAANAGQLQSVSSENSWLRDAQRFPVIVRFDDDSARGKLRAGGQADVTIYTSGNWVTNALAWLWMRFISIMSYAY